MRNEPKNMWHPLGSDDRGLTLAELLVVLLIIAVLISVAVGSYLGARQRAERSVAQANLRGIVPSLHAYHFDNGTYVGATLDGLKADYNAGIEPAIYSFG